MIHAIVAIDENGAIGRQGELLCYLPADMRHFKEMTMGNSIVMGRKTFESLPNGALPHRRNVIITRHCDTMKERFQGCIVYDSLENALKYEAKNHEVFIIGGGSIYRQALPLADKIYATLIEQEPKEADAWFPEIDMSKWHITKKEKHTGFSFLLLERR